MRKKGSSFVMVVIMTALIFTTATAMIALVTTDYKNRITQSRRLENMYGTDAEVDVVYNSIVKNCDAAVIYANHKVKKAIDDGTLTYSGSPQYIYNEANKLYKKEFIRFLYSKTTPIDLNNQTSFSNTEQILAYGIINRKYVEPRTGATDADLENIDFINAYKWSHAIEGTKGAKQNAEFKITDFEPKQYDDTNTNILVAISSTFTSTGNVDDMTNKRTVSMKFRINAPDYNQKMGNETVQVETASYPIEKALVTDNNLNVNKGTTTVAGDIWVKGNDDSISYSGTSYSYDKYNAGIFVNNASTFNVNNGNLYTANTLNIQKNSNVTVDQDVYALNAYIGPKSNIASDSEAETVGTNNSFTVKNLVTNNDLTMNSKKSKAIIESFYGINDKSIADTDIIIDAESKKNSSRNSSSIIVNEYAGSTLEFKNYVLVQGVAYIETDESYKTGESVGVKGNYKAYSDVLPSGKKVTFKEYDPLTLVENNADGNKMSVSEKADYFNEFFSDPNNSSILLDGGIQFDNINRVFTLGAYVYKDKDSGKSGVNRGGVTSEVAQSIVQAKQRDFAKYVFAMDDLVYTKKSDTELYLGNSVVNTVEKLVDFSKSSYIPKGSSELNLTESYGKLFYNTDEAKTITITKDGIEIDGKVINSKIQDKVDKGDNAQYALIVTKGKVNITGGDVNFKGCIIAVGDINIDGDGTKNIAYDSEAVKQIKAKYSGVSDINSIFKGTPTINDPKTTIGTKISSSTIQNEPYDAASYLQKGLWRLEK